MSVTVDLKEQGVQEGVGSRSLAIVASRCGFGMLRRVISSMIWCGLQHWIWPCLYGARTNDMR